MIIDFLMFFVLILSIVLGYRRGICAILLSFAAFAISIIITISLYSAFSEKIIDTQIGNNINKSISRGVNEYVDSLQNEVVNKIPFINADKKSLTADKLTEKAVDAVLSLFLLIGAFLSSKIIIFVLRKLLRFATELPVIHMADSLLGSLGGLLLGVIWVGLIYVYSGYLSLIDSLPFVYEQFNSSVLIMFISDFILWF